MNNSAAFPFLGVMRKMYPEEGHFCVAASSRGFRTGTGQDDGAGLGTHLRPAPGPR